MNTLASTYALLGSVDIKGMRLPAFDKNRIIAEHNFMVFDQQCNYDVILGGDFLRKIGMNLHYNDLTIEWLGNTAPIDSLNNPELVAREVESYLYQMDLEDEGFDAREDSYASPILDAKYGKVEIEEVIKDNCSRLDPDKQRQLRDVLLKHEILFDGVLEMFPGQPMHIGLIPEATPVYRRP